MYVKPERCARVIRFSVHVNPGATRSWAGGTYAGALGVHVRARAREGAATKEVLDVLADAFGVKNGAVTILHGEHARTKLVQIEGDATLERRLEELLTSPKT